MSSALTTEPQLGVGIPLVPWLRNWHRGQSRALGSAHRVWDVPCPESWPGPVCQHRHPKPPAVRLGSDTLRADSRDSHFTRLDVCPALCLSARHVADVARAFISPPPPRAAAALPGDPQQDLPPPLQATIDPPRASASPSTARAALQTPLPPALGWHRSGATFHVPAASPSQKSHDRTVLCPSDSALCALCCRPLSPLPHGTCCHVVLFSCLSFPT